MLDRRYLDEKELTWTRHTCSPSTITSHDAGAVGSESTQTLLGDHRPVIHRRPPQWSSPDLPGANAFDLLATPNATHGPRQSGRVRASGQGYSLSSRRQASRTCPCRWRRACCPTIGRNRRPPLVRWLSADLVMLMSARLNWLLSHGKCPSWSGTTRFVQVDISATGAGPLPQPGALRGVHGTSIFGFAASRQSKKGRILRPAPRLALINSDQ